MIIDASVVIDAVADGGARGDAARRSLAAIPADEPLRAPGHFAAEVLSGLQAVAGRPTHAFGVSDISAALTDAEAIGVHIEATPWSDVRRAWELAGSLRYADALYVAAAERYGTSLLTADTRIERSGAPIRCVVSTVIPVQAGGAGSHGAPDHAG